MNKDILLTILYGLSIVLFIGLITLLTLWAYDGDIKCLIAECVRIKK
jgi:hypothetical protein